MAMRNQGRITCPRTGAICNFQDLSKAYISWCFGFQEVVSTRALYPSTILYKRTTGFWYLLLVSNWFYVNWQAVKLMGRVGPILEIASSFSSTWPCSIDEFFNWSMKFSVQSMLKIYSGQKSNVNLHDYSLKTVSIKIYLVQLNVVSVPVNIQAIVSSHWEIGSLVGHTFQTLFGICYHTMFHGDVCHQLNDSIVSCHPLYLVQRLKRIWSLTSAVLNLQLCSASHY